MALSRHLRVIYPQYNMNGNKKFYDTRLYESDSKHDGSECLRKAITMQNELPYYSNNISLLTLNGFNILLSSPDSFSFSTVSAF